MVNQSKKNDPRFWKKWRDSGAVGTMESAIDRLAEIYDQIAFSEFDEVLRKGGAIIEARGINFENDYTTLSIGVPGTEEYVYLAVPNNCGLKPGERLTRLPKGAVSVERVYGARSCGKSSWSRKTRTPVRASQNQPEIKQISVRQEEGEGKKYLQTNEHGYV